MITAAGCRQRREDLFQRLHRELGADRFLFTDPITLRYLANFGPDPISLNAEFSGVLLLCSGGEAHLICDNRLAARAKLAFAEKIDVVNWYDGQSAGKGTRRNALAEAVSSLGAALRDDPFLPVGYKIQAIVGEQRRAKYPDEVAQLKRCMQVAEAGFRWARQNVSAGMTELEVYSGIVQACNRAAERAVIVYGDFAVSPGSSRRGGAATTQVLKTGDTLILDYSVVLEGYRSDFTNTLCVGGEPSKDQQNLMRVCQQAMQAGENLLRAGGVCQTIYDVVAEVFRSQGLLSHFPHHAGHGLGLTHPEAPFFVLHSSEQLLAGDVVTLEPGLYIDGIGGVRIEHNYLITEAGFERLSNHEIGF
ncbi:MAG: Xaa-Pro peptidase family protein [Gemmataceae bacterium]|jgi:Xaa-Pro aminopeptidase|nr:Xaa-Pro peptidase family protein [Gemmataceae bacterium]